MIAIANLVVMVFAFHTVQANRETCVFLELIVDT